MKLICERCGDSRNYTKKNTINCNIEECNERNSIVCWACLCCINCGNEFDPNQVDESEEEDIETEVESSEYEDDDDDEEY